MDGKKVNRLDNPQPSLFITNKEEGSQTVRREVFQEKGLRDSRSLREISVRCGGIYWEEMPVEESPSMLMDRQMFRR